MDKDNNKRTPVDTKRVFISTKIKKVNSWSKEEDEVLLSLAEKYGYKHWKKIAEALKNRSSIQCSARYKRIRPGLIKGSWTKEEDNLVLEMVEQFGKNWSLISKYIPSRTGKQIRDRYLNALDSNINKDKFSEEEDKKIIELYLQYGSIWSNIAKFFEKRTGDMIKNRFYSTLRKRVHGDVKAQRNLNVKIRLSKKIKKAAKIKERIRKIMEKNPLLPAEKGIEFNNNELEMKNIPIKQGEDISKLRTDATISKFTLAINPKETPSLQINSIEPKEPLQTMTLPSPSFGPQFLETPVIAFAQNNYTDYYHRIRQIESSMNQSLINYLNFSHQYQIMNSIYNLYNGSDKENKFK